MPEDTQKTPHISTLALWCLVLVCILGALGFIFGSEKFTSTETTSPTSDTSLSDAIRAGEAPAPTFTAEVKEKLTKSSGFDVLISYTDRGFEPGTVTVAKGDTIRFTNNSSHDLQIQEKDGVTRYSNGACDVDALASCATIAPQDFWEFTFSKTGTWTVVNGSNKTHTSVVKVQ